MLILISLAAVACAPMSKEAYMEKYAKFMLEVSQNSSSYTESDWAEKDEIFYEYSEIYYQKFQKELTSSDKMTLAKYKVKYSYYKCMSKSEAKVSDLFGAVAGRIESFGNDLLDTFNEATEEDGKLDEYLNVLSDKAAEIMNQF